MLYQSLLKMNISVNWRAGLSNNSDNNRLGDLLMSFKHMESRTYQLAAVVNPAICDNTELQPTGGKPPVYLFNGKQETGFEMGKTCLLNSKLPKNYKNYLQIRMKLLFVK